MTPAAPRADLVELLLRERRHCCNPWSKWAVIPRSLRAQPLLAMQAAAAYIGDVSALSSLQLPCGRSLLFSGSGTFVSIADACSRAGLCRLRALEHARVHGHAVQCCGVQQQQEQVVLLLTVWGHCELKVRAGCALRECSRAAAGR